MNETDLCFLELFLLAPATSGLGGKDCRGINSQEESGMLLEATNGPSDFFFDVIKFRTCVHNDDNVYLNRPIHIKWCIKNKIQERNKKYKINAYIGWMPLLIIVSSFIYK